MFSVSAFFRHIISLVVFLRQTYGAQIRIGARLMLCAALILFFVYGAAPADFPNRSLVSIPRGATLSSTASAFHDAGIIRSPFVFTAIVTLFFSDSGARAGNYFFEEPLSVWRVAERAIKGDYGLVPLRVTIPEGATVRDIASIFSKKILEFDEGKFLEVAIHKEGYLFPDTYFFLPDARAEDIVDRMEENFNKHIATILPDITAFGRPLRDVVIMASLLEKEARETETREIISGILWKRERIGIPLQVDAVFPYIIGKNTFELTVEDLQADSPYNTYTRRGLPVGPIGNPGLDALRGAVHPRETEYFYYLSDKDGIMHYSEDFEGHKRNKEKYLW